jgi:cation diffusion facilitator family transporter
MSAESKRTIYAALGANGLIAVAKLAGGLISGSAAMLAEAAHSLADTVNQVFLLVSLSLGSRPADAEHPFGYGKERFFWAFLAAVFIFVSGAVFSIVEGVRALFHGEEETAYLVAYVVLGVSFLAEGGSLLLAIRQLRGDARAKGWSFKRYVRESTDPTARTVLFEDSAAVLGLILAFLGILAHELTGQPMWDGIASILIGILLAVVAYVLGRDTKALLIGETAGREDLARIRKVLTDREGVTALLDLRTMHIGPESVLVAARLDIDDRLRGEQVEALTKQLETELREAVPAVGDVFLHAQAGPPAPAPTPPTSPAP